MLFRSSKTDILVRIEALGIDPALFVDNDDEPEAVRLFRAWGEAMKAEDAEAALAAYAALVARLDADSADASLDPLRNGLHEMREKSGDGWPFGALPVRPPR